MTKEQAQQILDLVADRQVLHDRVLEAEDKYRKVDKKFADLLNSLIQKEVKYSIVQKEVKNDV